MPKTASPSNFRYMLIDGNALIHRGFHAIPPLTTKAGEPTNAVYGFTTILLRAIKDLKPTHIACAFDLKGPTFRHERYANYKATRVKAAQELYDQIPRVHDVVAALNIPIFEQKGFEADDVLGTLAHKICGHQNNGCDVMIVTGDLDTLQLVNDCVKIYTLRKGLTDIAIYDTKAVRERYGLNPDQMVDFKALRGDPSDNIKGVKGIGEKGAIDLIKQYGSIENLYKAIHAGKTVDKIKARTLELLKADEDAARLSHELSVIKCDLDLDAHIPPYEFVDKNLKATVTLFQELEFHSLITKLPKDFVAVGKKPKGAVKEQAADNAPETVAAELKDPVQKKGDEKYDCANKEVPIGKLIKTLEKFDEWAVDTETTSTDAIRAKLVGVSFGAKPTEAFYMPADNVAANPQIKKFLEDPKKKKIGHNIKYDLLTLENAGINLQGEYFDTMLASYLLNAGTRQHGLDALAFNELGYQMQPIEDLIGKGKKAITMDQVPVDKVSWYACEDADFTLQLKHRFESELKKQGVDKIFYDIEMPLVRVLSRMERAGIKLDVTLLELLANDVKKRLHAIERDIYRLAGEEFNLNSPIQMREVLFVKMGLTSPSNKKTKTGMSTAAGELEKMADQHEIIPKILEYRELSKLQSTYILALPEMVNPDTGRIHTSYNQTIAATGRLSSVDPNLQNIPVRGDGVGAEIRKAFVAERGYELLSLDYSQIELRIVAHLSGDKNMLRIFKNDEDIHTNTAMEVFGVPADQVTADMRRDAKTINFGILYGLSAFGLHSRIASIQWHSAKEFIDKYFAAYPGMKNYIDGIKESVKRDGFVRNELGRIRRFPEINASAFMVRAAAERQAVNFPIQSLAADVIKVAMINIHKELAGKEDEIKMLLQVHDELVFEVKKDKVEYYAKLICPMMEQAIRLSVPVRAEAKVGKNWGEMRKLKL